MPKWKEGEIVTINCEKFQVYKTKHTPSDCIDCEFCKTHIKKYPCNECTDGKLIPEDCIFIPGF